jgi:cysteine sulfinate desulfinase/cysteine desulfurase-like protein
MGLDAVEARTALRFTFGSTTTPGDGVTAAEAVAEAIG